MKIERKQLNIVRLLAHHPDLQELVNNEISYLADGWGHEMGSISSGSKGQTLDEIWEYQASPFITQLYDNIWATILEEENWNENAILSQHAQDALPNANSPFGFRKVYRGNKPTLVPHRIESEVVKLIYTWYTALQYSLRDIAQALTELHLPTPYDIHMKQKTLETWGVWDMTVIQRIISSLTYIGQWTYYNGRLQKPVTVEVPGIVSPQLYEKAQACLSTNTDQPQHTLKYEYIFAFRTTCGVCGSDIQLHAKRSADTIYQYYRCPTSKCQTRGFRADETDPTAWSWLRSQLDKEQEINKLFEAFQTQKERRILDTKTRLQIIDQYLNEYRRQLTNLSKLTLPGSFLKNALRAYQNRLSLAVKNLEEAQNNLENKLQKQNKAAISLSKANDDFSTKRLIIELIDAHIIIQGRNDNRQVKVISEIGEIFLTLPKRSLK